ncbi:Gfo/Idh/MocA family protein [Herbiconiux ginsengi]|uniref:Predicted dehydrogenase n=1 Tax=Herbiconiux ginsengi TaxID=381665 RepID=A0A1H3TCR8_9MICO|nr:Gfo/Idh/MocA family oxidoreductase [Herbiconiux ginsengi]SDZ48024.1 Predicted dehydrogenase [Herbiconiux ginsengi]
MVPRNDVGATNEDPTVQSLRIGILGAARITKIALIDPALSTPAVEISAIAARNRDRASRFARDHNIGRVHDNYSALLRDPDIDAVYIPLPASAHAEWTLAAIAAGKHVLCEKPFTANAVQAEKVASIAAKSEFVVMEAYHTGHHPMMGQLRQYLSAGTLGEVVSAHANFAVAIPPGTDIRWNADLGGGGLLDVGYYPVRLLRDLFGEAKVAQARARDRQGIDSSLTARLEFAGGVRGQVACSLWPPRPAFPSLTITGSLGTLRVRMPYHPQTAGLIKFTSKSHRWSVRPARTSTYVAQLTAFRDAALRGGPNITDAPAAVRQMRTIDEIYQAAGMNPRCYSTPPVSRED